MAAALAGCASLVVHACSNHGFAFWCALQQRFPELAPKLRCVVFDCAMIAGAHFTPEHWQTVLSTTVSTAMVILDAAPASGSGKARARLRAAAPACAAKHFAAGSRGTFEEALEWQLGHEPPVPTLCLTSPDDVVIPPAAVEAFAQKMRLAQPSRDVQVAHVRGPHGQLASSSPEEVQQRIESLVGRSERRRPEGAPVGSMARVRDVQAACLADDINISETMCGWSEERLVDFFERGGVEGV